VYEKLIEVLKRYKIPDVGVYFVNRFEELREILNITSKEVTSINIVYGPWGCGKTEFARALTYVFENIESDVTCIYLNPLEEKRVEWGVKITGVDVREYIQVRFNVSLEELLSTCSISELVVKLVKTIGYTLYQLVEKWRLRGRRVLIIIDEVKKILEHQGYTINDLVTALYNGRGLREELQLKNLTYIIMTSDQVIVEDALREFGKCNIYLIWHLDYYSSRKLCEYLNLDNIDLIIKLTGGCPRAIISIKELGLKTWINNVISNLRNIIVKIQSKLKYTLSETLTEIRKVVDDVDTFDMNMEVKNILVRENILTYIVPNRLSSIPEDYWIGKYWAWQMPIYYIILKLFTEKRLHIDADDAIKHLSTS